MATLDAQKAFDVVSHPVLMVKLYEQGTNSQLWRLIRCMYSDLTARVKWSGEIIAPLSTLVKGCVKEGSCPPISTRPITTIS